MKNSLKNVSTWCKNFPTVCKNTDLKTRAEIVAQAALYLFIAPRAYLFFYGTSVDALYSARTVLLGALVTLIFVVSYLLALALMKNTTARERWALFFLSFVLIPLPLGLAYAFSQKLKNPWASMVGAVAVYIAAQIGMSFVFRYYLTAIELIVR